MSQPPMKPPQSIFSNVTAVALGRWDLAAMLAEGGEHLLVDVANQVIAQATRQTGRPQDAYDNTLEFLSSELARKTQQDVSPPELTAAARVVAYKALSGRPDAAEYALRTLIHYVQLDRDAAGQIVKIAFDLVGKLAGAEPVADRLLEAAHTTFPSLFGPSSSPHQVDTIRSGANAPDFIL